MNCAARGSLRIGSSNSALSLGSCDGLTTIPLHSHWPLHAVKKADIKKDSERALHVDSSSSSHPHQFMILRWIGGTHVLVLVRGHATCLWTFWTLEGMQHAACK